MEPVQSETRGLVAGSAVIAFAISLIALAAAGLGLIAAVPAAIGLVTALRARAQLKESPYRGYGISLAAFLISVGVLLWVLVPVMAPLILAVVFLLPH